MNAMTQGNKNKISESLGKLEEIVAWFEKQKEVDVEEGLEKVKAGAELIKELKQRLQKVENEFHEIKQGLQEESKFGNEVNEETQL